MGEFIDLPQLGPGVGSVSLQKGSTLFDTNTTSTGIVTLQIPLDASDYQFGYAQVTIPQTGIFTNSITISKRGLTSRVWFTTVATDSHAISTTPLPYTIYPGYTDVYMGALGFTRAQDGNLTNLSFAANGSFSSGSPITQILRIKSLRINGANIDVELDRPTGAGTCNIVFQVDWRVWKVAT